MLDIVAHQKLLLITGERRNRDDGSADQHRQTPHRGITGRPFERRFKFADYLKVSRRGHRQWAAHDRPEERGPEEMRARRIEVRGSTSLGRPQAMRQVGGEARAA